MIDTSTSSSSTMGDRWTELGMDRHREDSRGSVANISSLRVSSSGSTISEKRSAVNVSVLRCPFRCVPNIHGCLSLDKDVAYIRAA